MVSVVAAAVIDRAEERWRTIRLAPAKINDAVKTKKANREIKRLVERCGEESVCSVTLIVGIVNSSAALFERVQSATASAARWVVRLNRYRGLSDRSGLVNTND